MKISELFGNLTFNEKVMREKLSFEVFRRFKATIEQGEPITRNVAECIAHALKEWALENNATHYTHWFQPLTGLTAEKHDAFLQFHDGGTPIERFYATELMQGEPDASSFPSGGTRTTFEARGYTAWDPKSPCFIIEGEMTNTLCIPSVFFSYNGDSLDKKSALIRSTMVLDEAAKELLGVMGYPIPQHVHVTAGAEQEYYLINREMYRQREDLMLTGRTLVGAPPIRGQKLSDHYFGSIPPDVKAFMEEVELELYRLGVPCKTRHNEVAPSQYEIAPVFEEVNIAADHNQLMMMMLKQKAAERGFALLLHEKPFQGLNGSGKHNNWSMSDETGTNYFSPGRNREEFLRFLCFLVAFVNAIHLHGVFIRASVASASNDHRLGGHEAPPSIVSVFVGSALEQVLTDLKNGNFTELTGMEMIKAGLKYVPQIEKDNTDRNRTSPVAFTGNKFEFRAVGSGQPLGFPNTVLNTAVAESMRSLARMIRSEISAGRGQEESTLAALSAMLEQCDRVVFNGNCYSREWKEEAKKRGLSNLRATPEALRSAFGSESEAAFLLEAGVLNQTELGARYEIKVEEYAQRVEIESRTLLKLIRKDIRPALVQQMKDLDYLDWGIRTHYREAVGQLERDSARLVGELEGLREVEGSEKQAQFCYGSILPLMEKIRDSVDFLEEETDRQLWRLPDYDQLLGHR
ncbi:MAG: glutamine synthetase type III [Acidobacteria bacterium CG_4_9_14_3_um_filter_49_7]|nr:MAG: glutamine synthetase type III [Acidobacteria bacterium CG_4_9_14_3_um_filter_49_7]